MLFVTDVRKDIDCPEYAYCEVWALYCILSVCGWGGDSSERFPLRSVFTFERFLKYFFRAALFGCLYLFEDLL